MLGTGCWYPHFNCTIQELKLDQTGWVPKGGKHFNCTIQELKLSGKLCLSKIWIFQLHHTGIKTRIFYFDKDLTTIFQLHHTGIKTQSLRNSDAVFANFNCTIQELKQVGVGPSCKRSQDFNCTIQELKRTSEGRYLNQFLISIAPYRN